MSAEDMITATQKGKVYKEKQLPSNLLLSSKV